MDRSTSSSASPAPQGGGSELSLRELPRAFRRRWRLFGGVFVGVIALVMGATLLIPPQYESEASLRVRSDQLGGLAGRFAGAGLEEALPLGGDLPIPSLGGMDGGHVQTEISVLQSRRILGSVMDSLALHVELTRPWRAFRTEVIEVDAGEDAPRGTYRFRLEDDGSYSASARGTRDEVALPERVTIGEPFSVGPMRFTLLPELAEDPPPVVEIRVSPYQQAFRQLRRDVRIERTDTGSRLVEARYRHADPHLARGLVNGLVERFMDYSLSEAVSDPRREARILEEQVATYAGLLTDVEDRLRAYQEQERLVAPQEQAIQQVERIAEVQIQHDALEVERQALSALLVEVAGTAGEDGDTAALPGAAASGGDAAPLPRYRRLATFPTFITNEAIQELLSTLTALENQRAELLVRRTEQNIDVQQVQGRIAEIEAELFTLGTDYLESLDLQLASARESLGRFQAELELVPAVELEYLRLTRERRLLSEIYLALRARLAEAQVQEVLDDARVRIVDLGVIEDRPVFPRPPIVLALSTVLGLMLGTFSVVAAETSNPNVRSRNDAEGAAGAPLLGSIPHTGRTRAGEDPLVMRRDAWHHASERFRGLALTLLASDAAPKTIVVAGPSAGDGRTTVAANLAVALAQQGERVALVDGDLRAGTLHDLLRVEGRPGWPEAAIGQTEVDAVSRAVDVGDGGGSGEGELHLLPAGMTSGHPLGILGSAKTGEFLERLRERYGIVIVDTPPVADGHDAAILAAAADGAVLVARADGTGKDALRDAAEAVRMGSGTVLGVVLNGEPAKDRRSRSRKAGRGEGGPVRSALSRALRRS